MKTSRLLSALLLLTPAFASCTREERRQSFDPELELLEIARNVCRAPGATLTQYLADERLHTRQLALELDSSRTADPHLDTVLSRMDSLLTDTAHADVMLDDSTRVEALETLAKQNEPAKYGLVAMQHLAREFPFPNVGWIDLFFGPIRTRPDTPFGRRHAGEDFFVELNIFVVSDPSSWLAGESHSSEHWHGTRNPDALIRVIQEAPGCDAIRSEVVR